MIYQTLDEVFCFEEVSNRQELVEKLVTRFSVSIHDEDDILIELANQYRAEYMYRYPTNIANDPIDW